MDPVSAGTAAVRTLAGRVAQQSMVLSFNRVFFAGGVLFLMVLPLLFFLRTPPPSEQSGRDVHLEI
jgi:MFS transporter, DHA2 family, multidrug resistance protein